MSRSTSPPTSPRKGKFMNVKVLMLDNTVTIFQIPQKALGRNLYEEVINKLQVLESDYFDLEYINSEGITCWLDHDKPILKQVGSPHELNFRFGVKFYIQDPALLEEELTRYLFALQVKRDLQSGTMPCNENTAALLVSYITQAELGDYIDDFTDQSYLSTCKIVPNQTIEEKIIEYHKRHTGQTPADADFNLLDTARKVELYGIKMYPAKDHEGVPLNLAVAHMGVLVFQNYTKINTFSWAKVRKLSFKRKKFLIKLHPEGYGYYKDTVEFYFDTRNECKNFWKKCIEHHAFFRCHSVKRLPRNKTRVVSRGSSFRYGGRTQKQLVEFVRENYVKRAPFESEAGDRKWDKHRMLAICYHDQQDDPGPNTPRSRSRATTPGSRCGSRATTPSSMRSDVDNRSASARISSRSDGATTKSSTLNSADMAYSHNSTSSGSHTLDMSSKDNLDKQPSTRIEMAEVHDDSSQSSRSMSSPKRERLPPPPDDEFRMHERRKDASEESLPPPPPPPPQDGTGAKPGFSNSSSFSDLSPDFDNLEQIRLEQFSDQSPNQNANDNDVLDPYELTTDNALEAGDGTIAMSESFNDQISDVLNDPRRYSPTPRDARYSPSERVIDILENEVNEINIEKTHHIHRNIENYNIKGENRDLALGNNTRVGQLRNQIEVSGSREVIVRAHDDDPVVLSGRKQSITSLQKEFSVEDNQAVVVTDIDDIIPRVRGSEKVDNVERKVENRLEKMDSVDSRKSDRSVKSDKSSSDSDRRVVDSDKRVLDSMLHVGTRETVTCPVESIDRSGRKHPEVKVFIEAPSSDGMGSDSSVGRDRVTGRKKLKKKPEPAPKPRQPNGDVVHHRAYKLRSESKQDSVIEISDTEENPKKVDEPPCDLREDVPYILHRRRKSSPGEKRKEMERSKSLPEPPTQELDPDHMTDERPPVMFSTFYGPDSPRSPTLSPKLLKMDPKSPEVKRQQKMEFEKMKSDLSKPIPAKSPGLQQRPFHFGRVTKLPHPDSFSSADDSLSPSLEKEIFDQMKHKAQQDVLPEEDVPDTKTEDTSEVKRGSVSSVGSGKHGSLSRDDSPHRVSASSDDSAKKTSGKRESSVSSNDSKCHTGSSNERDRSVSNERERSLSSTGSARRESSNSSEKRSSVSGKDSKRSSFSSNASSSKRSSISSVDRSKEEDTGSDNTTKIHSTPSSDDDAEMPAIGSYDIQRRSISDEEDVELPPPREIFERVRYSVSEQFPAPPLEMLRHHSISEDDDVEYPPPTEMAEHFSDRTKTAHIKPRNSISDDDDVSYPPPTEMAEHFSNRTKTAHLKRRNSISDDDDVSYPPPEEMAEHFSNRTKIAHLKRRNSISDDDEVEYPPTSEMADCYSNREPKIILPPEIESAPPELEGILSQEEQYQQITLQSESSDDDLPPPPEMLLISPSGDNNGNNIRPQTLPYSLSIPRVEIQAATPLPEEVDDDKFPPLPDEVVTCHAAPESSISESDEELPAPPSGEEESQTFQNQYSAAVDIADIFEKDCDSGLETYYIPMCTGGGSGCSGGAGHKVILNEQHKIPVYKDTPRNSSDLSGDSIEDIHGYDENFSYRSSASHSDATPTKEQEVLAFSESDEEEEAEIPKFSDSDSESESEGSEELLGPDDDEEPDSVPIEAPAALGSQVIQNPHVAYPGGQVFSNPYAELRTPEKE